MTSKIFSAKMYELMGWNTACRYKILGHKIVYEDEMLYILTFWRPRFFGCAKNRNTKAGVQAGASKGTENAQKMIMEGIDLTSHGDHPRSLCVKERHIIRLTGVILLAYRWRNIAGHCKLI